MAERMIEDRGVRTAFDLVRRLSASPARHPRIAVVLGRLLGTGFVVCFLTGVYSHFIQDPLPFMVFPTRPVALYRITQGLHVTVGIALIPLLLAKLWTVQPLLFQWPPARSVAGVLERASIALLVAASLVELAIGLCDVYQWYPFPFRFRQTHFALAWVIVGSIAVHVAVKLPIIVRWWRRRDSVDAEGRLLAPGPGEGDLGTTGPYARGLTGALQRRIAAAPQPPGRISRRAVLGATGAASAVLVATTVGQTLPALAPLNAFAPRKLRYGPQGLPVNRTAAAARVLQTARDPGWTLTVAHGDRSQAFSLADLRGMDQAEASLPIACVEGWSTEAHWRGVRLRDLMAEVGGSGRDVVVRSFATGAYATTLLEADFAGDPLTLIALELNGETLHVDHGYPARLIAPARPGVLQTKWLRMLETR